MTDALRPVRPTRGRVVVVVWSVVLALLLLGPALGPGFVLSYDMVWVPDLALRPDALGLGSGLPRAVPSDAVVAVLDELVPGAWLQHLVLGGAVIGGGLGAARLVPDRLEARLLAVSLWQWNAFVVERLVIGHWPVLLAYGVLPWLLVAARRWRESGRPPAVLALLVPLGSLSASAGVATAIVLLAATAGRRRLLPAVVLATAANAPWIAAGLLHAGQASAGATGSALFALSPEGSVPAPLAALSLGGIWNSEVVPDSRVAVSAWVSLVVLVALAALGWRRWWREEPVRDRRTLLGLWGVGWVLGLATWSVPGVVDQIAAVVPGGGLLRDGGRLLLLCAPLLVVLVTRGVLVLADRVPRVSAAQAGLLLAAALLPLALLPDAAWGVSGRVSAVDYPRGWAAAGSTLDGALDRGTASGDLLVLPRGAFRRFSWNDDRTVLDPVARYLRPDPVVDDVLVVDGQPLGGEDPRAAAALDLVDSFLLDRADGATVVRGLQRLGIGVVVLEEETITRLPAPTESDDEVRTYAEISTDLPGTRTLAQGRGLTIVALPAGADRGAPLTWILTMTAAWTAFALLLGVGTGALLLRCARALRARLRGEYPGGSSTR